jgi:hypothetical protein
MNRTGSQQQQDSAATSYERLFALSSNADIGGCRESYKIGQHALQLESTKKLLHPAAQLF